MILCVSHRTELRLRMCVTSEPVFADESCVTSESIFANELCVTSEPVFANGFSATDFHTRIDLNACNDFIVWLCNMWNTWMWTCIFLKNMYDDELCD
jgi:hypothetical protein